MVAATNSERAVLTSRIPDRATWRRLNSAALSDPGAFHGAIAARNIHWFAPDQNSWLTQGEDGWSGWSATGAAVAPSLPSAFRPWSIAFDASDPPFFRWFSGGRTNACFNEVDRHVLAGHGDETALIFEGDRWDMATNAPVEEKFVSRKRLLLETAKCALALKALGLAAGDRIAINMPNIVEQIYWTEAAKRVGVIYTPVFGGFSDKTLSDRIEDAGAKVVITADGGYRQAQVAAFKTAYTDPALDNYIPAKTAAALAAERLRKPDLGLAPATADIIVAAIESALAGEITVERGDVMRGVGRALVRLTDDNAINAAAAARVRIAVAEALVAAPPARQGGGRRAPSRSARYSLAR